VRIAFCITELDPGGAERCLAELVTRLDRRQFDPLVYCLGPRPVGNPISLADVLEQSGVPVYCFGARWTVEFPWVLRRLRRQFASDSPQIVQSFLFHANVLATLAAHRAGVRHIVTGIRVAERRSLWHLVVARLSGRWVQRHVCVSQAVREFSRRETGLPENKLVVIPNGVDAQRFASAVPCPLESLGLAPGRRAIVYVGRLEEQKGLAWLLEQMPRVLGPAPDYDLLLVGAGPQREPLMLAAERLGIGRRVHFAGYRPDVAEILAASDLLVLASEWEGMPNAVLEAMASGKPVVAANVDGVLEALGPAAVEQVFPPRDAEAFVRKVLAILDDPLLAARLGQQNQQRARQEFSLEAMVGAYQQLYASLLAANP
jgi:glycosyltransferase involved in cell wall biosynthesis